MDKFEVNDWPDLPVDDDTKVISRRAVTVMGLSAVHEHWNWDGLHGESTILRNRDVEDKDDQTLRNAVISQLDVLDIEKMTVSRGDKYTMINFNFRH